MIQHTPTRWTAYDGHDHKLGRWVILGPTLTPHVPRQVVANLDLSPEAAPNARYIVQAVNAHEDLLAALKAIAHTVPCEDTDFRALCAILIATARIAVEQAEKGEA